MAMQNIEQSKSDSGTELPPIKFTNLIQFELIKESQEDPVVWIAKNSENFRKLLQVNPNLIEDYKKVENDESSKVAFLKFVAGALRDVEIWEGGGEVEAN